MSSQADRMPDLPRKPMMRLDRRPHGRVDMADRPSTGLHEDSLREDGPHDYVPTARAAADDGLSPGYPPLSFVPTVLPAAWRQSPQAPVAVRHARALSDDERLAAAAMYLWLRNRALDSGGEGPLVMLCDPHGWPVGDSDGAPRSLDGQRLDAALAAAMNADR